MRSVVAFIVIFALAVLVMGLFGAVGRYELLVALVIALLAALVRRRRSSVA